jgi:hypothetical protein
MSCPGIAVQLEAGTGKAILEDTQTKLDYVQEGWVVGIRRFLSIIEGAIQVVDAAKPDIYRQNDAYLMDIFRQHSIPTAVLRQLNRCRLYFQVARLSDISTIAGDSLYAHVLPLLHPATQQTNPIYPRTTLDWPRQPRPGPAARRLWRTTLKQILLQADGRLRQTLGHWKIDVDKRDRQYPAIYHAHTQQIHQLHGTQYRPLQVHTCNRRIIKATITDAARSLRTPDRPVDIIQLSNNLLTAQYTPSNLRLRHQQNHTYHHCFRQLPQWAADLLQHLVIHEEHVHLLRHSDRIVVSDGGVDKGKG